MAVNESIHLNQKYRVLTDKLKSKWSRISFWKKASDVEFNNGENYEDRTYSLLVMASEGAIRNLTASNGAIFQFDYSGGKYGFWAYGSFYPFGG